MFEEIYAIVRQADNIDEMQARLGNRNIHETGPSPLYETVAYLLARESEHEKVEWLHRLGASVDDIAEGYASIGNHQYVEAYRTDHGADVGAILIGYALAGNHDYVETYRSQYGLSLDFTSYAYDLADNHEKASEYNLRYLLDKYINRREQVTEQGITKDYFYSGLFSGFQNSFSYTQKLEAVNELVSALNGDSVDLVYHLPTLINGRLGKELRQFVKGGHGNHLVGKEVNTVSEFVKTLQDRIKNNPKEVINIKKGR